MGGLKIYGNKVYKMNRTKKERWHLLRTMATQLVEHERITSTKTKCKALRAMAERVLLLAKRVAEKNDENARRELQGILTTDYARKKAIKEIAPRFKDKNNCFTRLMDMKTHRRGDHAPLAYIEYVGNDIERYEQSAKQERIQKGIEVDRKEWTHNVLKQERDFFEQKLNEVQEESKLKSLQDQELLNAGKITQQEYEQRQIVNQGQIQFFQQKINQTQHDLFIANKNPFDLQKFASAGFLAGISPVQQIDSNSSKMEK